MFQDWKKQLRRAARCSDTFSLFEEPGFWILFLALPAYGQIADADVTQRVLPVAELRDLDFINSFLEENFIFPQDPDYSSGVFF
ncbi:MAG: hypothetical protein OXD43_12490 [Bacteroidetes bacterium]|nr:hypothetical protein [Bacteroidota bacterium]